VTYPNVLVMGYLKATGQLTPKWQMKLEAALNAGYQRLLTFEVSGGGFDWYGASPAKTILTAYGILELNDMDKVYPIDRRVIDRARDVLYRRQNADGSWSLDIPMHTWNQLTDAKVPITAYVAWALHEAGFKDSSVDRALGWLKAQPAPSDGYVAALVALALGKTDALEALAQVEGDQARWSTAGEGLCHARGETASIEATALAAIALAHDARSPLLDKALTAIARSKDGSGCWQSTQATILCIKALLDATRAPSRPKQPVAVLLAVNGRPVEGLKALSAENYDVVQQVELPVAEGVNQVELSLEGDVRATYQVFGRYYLPWALVPEAKEPLLAIATRYDKEELKLTDKLRATTTLQYSGPGTFMVIADLGIPPGFTPDASSFEKLVEKKVIDKFTLTGRQVTLYFGRVEKGRRHEIEWTLAPRFPIKAQSPRSNAYEYYSPQNEGTSRPRPLRVLED
jgi:hypothetical protein